MTYIRSAMLDDATSGRPTRNDDIARDFLRNAVAYCFSNISAAENWRENVHFVLGKMAVKLRSLLLLLSGSFPGVRYATKPTK